MNQKRAKRLEGRKKGTVVDTVKGGEVIAIDRLNKGRKG